MVYTGTSHESTPVTPHPDDLQAALDALAAGVSALGAAVGGCSVEATVAVGDAHAATLRRRW